MNREILFRGKRIDKPTDWVEGYYCKIKDEDNILDSNACFHKVIPETVGQYTGEKVHGSYLFEGDIVESESGCEYVFYEDGEYRLSYNMKRNQYDSLSTLLPLDFTFKIIGNIHDNKELLNEQE